MPRARTPRSGEGCRAQSNANRTRGKSAPGGAQTKNTVRTTVRSYLQGRGKRKEKRGISLATAPRMGVYKKGKHKPEGRLPEVDLLIPHELKECPRRPADRRRRRGKGMVGPSREAMGETRHTQGKHHHCPEAAGNHQSTTHTHTHTHTHIHTHTRRAADFLITLLQLAPSPSTSSRTGDRRNLAGAPAAPNPEQ